MHHDHDGREPSDFSNAMTAVELSSSVEAAEGGVFGCVKLIQVVWPRAKWHPTGQCLHGP